MHRLFLAAAITVTTAPTSTPTQMGTENVPVVRHGMNYPQARRVLSGHPRVVESLVAGNRQGSAQIERRSPAIREACETEKVWLSWNDAIPNATLVTCDCSCTSHDNSGWLVETGLKDDVPRVRRVTLGKLSGVVEFNRYGERVPDTFASHPWCSGTKPKMPINAVFATLMKQPTEAGDAPYCFTPHFFVGSRSAPLWMTPMSGEMFSDAPAAESALIAREVEILRASWRRLDSE